MKNGKFVNLFNPSDMKSDFLSVVGYGAIMGMLKHYEVMNPFVSATTDSLNRLKPGFEAPVCIVTALGGDRPDVQTRNRSVLIGLIRNIASPAATRFELRSPNPFTNTYIAIAMGYLAALDGIKYALSSGKNGEALLAELSKKPGEDADYLEKDRAYRSEVDVFENFTSEERDAMFGKARDGMGNFKGPRSPSGQSGYPGLRCLPERIMESFRLGALNRWALELQYRLIPETSPRSLRLNSSTPTATATPLKSNAGPRSTPCGRNWAAIRKRACLFSRRSKKPWLPKTTIRLPISWSK